MSNASVPARPRLPLAVVAGLFLASLATFPQLLAIGPLLPLIREDLGLSATVAGLLTSIPVLCMGIGAPIGPRLAARVGPRTAFALCMALIIGAGIARAAAPGPLLVLVATFGIGIGIGIGGVLPAMVVSARLPGRPALGIGAYAAGLVAGGTIASGIAVPLALVGDWRSPLLVISLLSLVSLAAWILLIPADPPRSRDERPQALRLPWRSPTAWLLVLAFGSQSIMFYGIVSWLPNAYVESGWTADAAGSLIALFNGVGLVTTIGVPFVADRLGRRRPMLLGSALVGVAGLVGVILAPELAYLWVVVLGLAIGIVFPLILTLPLDVADDPGRVGSVAALMLFGGYTLSAIGPFTLGAFRDLTGDFSASLWLLVVVAVALVVCVAFLSPARLQRGISH